ncbi:MAG TPA: hypothetical protein VGF12_20770, partial [Roseateles sp.]|uniref:hypothetical protein n=1 Tax=Roseateles sp. TaxID=1971397 RepID=UPI002ED9509B
MRHDLSNPSLLAGGIALTLAALVGLELLPARTMDLAAPGAANGPYLITADGRQESSAVQWLDAGRLRLRCNYASPQPYLGCGLTFILTDKDPTRGRDLSRFDTIELDLAYQGPAPFVRLAIRNFDPRFAKLEDANSARFHSVNLRPRDIARPVTV